MAAKNPIRGDYSGSDLVGFAEFQASDFIAIADGGTGAISAAGARTALGIAIGSDVQAYDPQLTDVANLTPTDGGFIVGDGSNFVLESGNTARASLGLSSSDSPQFTGLTLTSISIDSVTLSTIVTESEGMSGSDNDTSVPTTAAIIDYISNTVDTTEEVQDIVGAMVTSNTETLIGVTYDDSDGTLDFVVDNDLANYSNTNSAFITKSGISVTDSGGDGSLSYDNSTGVITYTGPSSTEVRAHLSAGTGVSYSSGQFSIGQDVGTSSTVQFANVSASSAIHIGPTSFEIKQRDDGKAEVSTDWVVKGDIFAENFVVTSSVTSMSVAFASGSTAFGDSIDDKHRFTGSIDVNGNVIVNGAALITSTTITTPDQYLRKQFVKKAASISIPSTASFTALTASAPVGMTATNEQDFVFFINGQYMEHDALTVKQAGSNFLLLVDTDSIGYRLEADDEIIAQGKFNS